MVETFIQLLYIIYIYMNQQAVKTIVGYVESITMIVLYCVARFALLTQSVFCTSLCLAFGSGIK